VCRDEVALRVEGVVNYTVHAEKELGGSGLLETLQLSLASRDCLMRESAQFEPNIPLPDPELYDSASCGPKLLRRYVVSALPPAIIMTSRGIPLAAFALI
jgi:hypothetical protein